jgi:hypothetical protein
VRRDGARLRRHPGSGLLPFAEGFTPAGADVLLVDYRGFGGSEGERRRTVDHRAHVATHLARRRTRLRVDHRAVVRRRHAGARHPDDPAEPSGHGRAPGALPDASGGGRRRLDRSARRRAAGGRDRRWRVETLELDCGHFDIYLGEPSATSLERQIGFLRSL